MGCWQQYVKASVEELSPFGNVLQVGFSGCIASEMIQSYDPKTHTIIEREPERVQEARKWACCHCNVQVLEGSWQDLLSTLSSFDSIFFHGSKDEKKGKELSSFCPKQGSLFVSQGQDLIAKIHTMFPQIKTFRYSDHEIQGAYEEIGSLYPKEFSRFLLELKEGGQIEPDQYEKMIKHNSLEKTLPSVSFYREEALVFLDKCLEAHLCPGGKFSCLSYLPTSKYEDPEFFDRVITDPRFDYQERLFPMDPSENNGFNEALIMVLHKVS